MLWWSCWKQTLPTQWFSGATITTVPLCTYTCVRARGDDRCQVDKVGVSSSAQHQRPTRDPSFKCCRTMRQEQVPSSTNLFQGQRTQQVAPPPGPDPAEHATVSVTTPHILCDAFTVLFIFLYFRIKFQSDLTDAAPSLFHLVALFTRLPASAGRREFPEPGGEEIPLQHTHTHSCAHTFSHTITHTHTHTNTLKHHSHTHTHADLHTHI